METITEKKEAGQEVYSARYKYGYNWSEYQNLSKHLMQKMADNKEMNKKIIDIGCGIGWYTDILYFNISRDITGIDFSKLAILFHARRMYPSVEFIIGDIYTHDYTGYQVAVLTEVLEHINNDLALLDRLPKGCRIYATVPFEKERYDPTHVREYSISSTMERYRDVMEIQACEKFEQYIYIIGTIK